MQQEQLPSSAPPDEGEPRSLESLLTQLDSKGSHPAAVDLLAVPWNDWEISDPSDIAICTRKDGSEWLLGAGAHGRVSAEPPEAAESPLGSSRLAACNIWGAGHMSLFPGFNASFPCLISERTAAVQTSHRQG